MLLGEMNDMIKDKGEAGATPEEIDHLHQIKATIDGVILPAIFDEIKDLMLELQMLYETILECQSVKDASYEAVEDMEKDLDTWEESHEECRKTEEFWYTQRSKECTEYDEFRRGIKIPDDMPSITRNDDEMTESDAELLEWLAEMSDYFCPIWEIFESKREQCHEVEKNFTKTTDVCKEVQEEYEEKFCTLREDVTGVCGRYEDCWDKAVLRYNNRKTQVLAHYETIKNEYYSATMVKCLWDAWQYEEEPCIVNETRVKICEEVPKYNFTNITIDLPPLPDPSECNVEKVKNYPCSEEFIDENYVIWGLAPEILQKVKDDCTACSEYGGVTKVNEQENQVLLGNDDTGGSTTLTTAGIWIMDKIKRSGDNIFTKISGQAKGFDAYLTTSCDKQMHSLTVKAMTTVHEIAVGFTTDPDDGPEFASGYTFSMLPNQELKITGGTASDTYKKGDEFTIAIDHKKVNLFKNNPLLYHWSGAERDYMYPKIWIFDEGAMAKVTDYHMAPVMSPEALQKVCTLAQP